MIVRYKWINIVLEQRKGRPVLSSFEQDKIKCANINLLQAKTSTWIIKKKKNGNERHSLSFKINPTCLWVQIQTVLVLCDGCYRRILVLMYWQRQSEAVLQWFLLGRMRHWDGPDRRWETNSFM